VRPEKLSPSHVFESSTLEEELLSQQQLREVGPESDLAEPRMVFDSRTFVIKKTPSPTNSAQFFGFTGMKVTF
jgi:hypothetical protein